MQVERDDEREAIARIIDPEAFLTLREIAAERGLDAANPPPGVVLLDPIDGPRNAMRPRCDIALTKAAEILAATALIAKAERVDAMTEAMRRIDALKPVPISDPHAGAQNGKILLQAKSIARNAVSPKGGNSDD